VRNSSVIARAAVLLALAIAVVAVTVILLGGGSTYQVKAIFQNASQIVNGDQVQVAGNPIGSVSNIALTPDGSAELTLNITNSEFAPLHQGTTAVIRLVSLSGIANRYVQLDLGPGNKPAIKNGGILPQSSTTSTVDLDELFNTLNSATRKGIQNVFEGSASQYKGRADQAQLAWQYLNPAIATASELFRELNRNTNQFTRFITTSSHLVTDLSSRQSDLSGLISHLSTTFTALANQHIALGQSLQRLPPFMRLTDTTFVNLRYALTDLTKLVNVTRPVAPRLQLLLQQLRPLAINAVPTVRHLANLISKPGPANDLIDLNHLAVPLAKVTVGHVYADGKLRPGAFPESTKALNGATPELAVGRPYAVDLTGWFEGYSHPGVYDANGGASRVAPVVGLGSIETGPAGSPNLLGVNLCTKTILHVIPHCSAAQNLLSNPESRLSFAKSVLVTGQGDRCPGSMERGPADGTSSAGWAPGGPLYPESGFPCNPREIPTGP
jgi:phospholipid/cholesterol/gamma-HCH transport system substrate-binding protein